MIQRSMSRHLRKLCDALGDLVCGALEDPVVVEVMLNPDGKLFIERLGEGMIEIGEMSSNAAEIVIGCVAHVLGSEVDGDNPVISGELPVSGHRFEGLLPPIVTAPSFSIRRRASRLFSLDDYVAQKVMTLGQAELIRNAILSRLNIIVCGGTGSGKTTLANAILAEVAELAPADRLVILEDTVEIHSRARNSVSLRTSERVDMARLLKSTMRLRPDRIIVGEVRDGAALTMLKAWNTGHPGGLCTIHSNSARSALQRLEQLTAEASQQTMATVIADTVDMIISVERISGGRRIGEILRVKRFTATGYQTVDLTEDERNAA